MASNPPHHIGIDLGGSSIKAVAVTDNGELIRSANVAFEDRDMEWAAKIEETVAAFQAGLGDPSGIGLSAPGLAARDERSISHMPGRLSGLEGLDWTRRLGTSFPVPVLNDAHAALLGEAWIGAAAGLQNVFMLTLGTGVGGAAIVDGHLLKGRLGRAGHLGHITVDFDGDLDDVNTPGSLESLIGNKTILRRSGGEFQTTHELVARHLAGDDLATEIWYRSLRALAAGIASLVNVLDPEAVILGGGIAKSGPALFKPLQLELDRVEWRPGGSKVRLLAANLGELAGAYGAARNSMKDAV
jgi:glucokinase